MKTDGYVDTYLCRCTGGDVCYIVRHPSNDVDISYPTMKEAEEELEKLRNK